MAVYMMGGKMGDNFSDPLTTDNFEKIDWDRICLREKLSEPFMNRNAENINW